jgi:hypothetical protein
VVVVATQGEELMNMVSGRQLVEVKQRYFRLVGIKGQGIEKGRKLEFVGCGT